MEKKRKNEKNEENEVPRTCILARVKEPGRADGGRKTDGQ